MFVPLRLYLLEISFRCWKPEMCLDVNNPPNLGFWLYLYYLGEDI